MTYSHPSLPRAITLLCRECHITLNALGRLAKISPPTLRRFMHGETVRVPAMERIAFALGLTPADLGEYAMSCGGKTVSEEIAEIEAKPMTADDISRMILLNEIRQKLRKRVMR